MVLISSGISRCILQGLVLFFFVSSCSRHPAQTNVSIIWENDRATGINIPRPYFLNTPDDSIKSKLEIHLIQGADQLAMLGEIEVSDNDVVFTPIIPFTRGLHYDVRIGGESIARIEIPPASDNVMPDLKAIYPSQDTLPHNLLKVYLEFTQPMREGQSLQYITLLKNGQDTIPSVFLDLQPELWNKERTVLTLWLDPGRIKRDLQPNRRMGAPLEENTPYRIVIAKTWNNVNGAVLSRDYHKDFYVHTRDSLSPDPTRWIIKSPEAGTRNPVQIEFNEPMDFVLLHEAIRIKDGVGNTIDGTIESLKEETILSFRPDVEWAKGSYILESESRLEDLAGNNLNRPFDQDLQQQSKKTQQGKFQNKFQVR
jgi:hypothetical protein